MLTDFEFEQLCERLRLHESGRRFATVTRKSPPSREVQSGSQKNTCTDFASRKLAFTIGTESKTAEDRIALGYEYDDDVLEVWNQPPAVPVTRTRRDGTRYSTHYTADFLLVRADGIRAIQVKPGKKVKELLAESPDDWQIVDGKVRDLAADAAFQLLGIPHEVVIADELPAVYYSNIRTLLQAREATNLVSDDLLHRLDKCFKAQACMPLAQLKEQLRLVDNTPLLQLIAQKTLFARLHVDSLTATETAWLARHERLLTSASLPLPQSLVEKAAQPPVTLPNESSAAHALQRIERLKGSLPKRTKARYRKLVRLGQREGKSLFDSLLPGYSRCGNRVPRLNPLQVQLINETIDTAYASDRRTDKKNAYRCYAVRSRDRYPEFRIVTPKTFRNFILQRNPAAIAGARSGRRLANAAAGPSPVESRDPAPTRPFERATIDHCQIPLHVVLHERGKVRITRQPWITVMRDVATGCILAYWLSLNDPSCIADAMVLRRCVYTWGRLPEQISTDRGRDFWSLYFRSALAHFGVHHSFSPPASSRHNSPAERPFGDMRTAWLQLRPGNSANPEEPRSISATHKAANTAELTLEEAWEEFLLFVDQFNNYTAGLGGDTAIERLHTGLKAFSCSGIPVVNNLEFRISTAVDVRRFKLDTRNGLRVNERRYWCNALAERKPASPKLKVRLDPEDPYVVYAFVNHAWHQCHANGADEFSRLTLTEKLAKATRLMEGRELTRKVRDECQQEFTRKILEVDAAREAKKGESPAASTEQDPLPKSRSLFDEVRDLSVEPPTDEHQEVSAYALDRIRHRKS